MKWEPLAAMAALLLLGIWVVAAPGLRHPDLRPGASTVPFNIAGIKGELEVVRDDQPAGPTASMPPEFSFRWLYRNAPPSPVIPQDRFIAEHGRLIFDQAVANRGNLLFRLLNVSSWAGLIWITLGFAGQAAFFARMALQWVVSEKRRVSVVPPSFWWLSLVGGILLFAYFAWRQDIVGVLGQTSGIVIYARNIRLLHKQQRRERRESSSASSETSPVPDRTPRRTEGASA